MSVREIAQLLEEQPRDIEQDLKHMLRSLKRTQYRAVITPAECRKCGFKFQKHKLRKPGKCPGCQGTWIREPRLGIEQGK